MDTDSLYDTAPHPHLDQQHRAWLAQIALGQQPALEQLYRALSGNVYAFVQRRIANPADADSLVVDTFHEVWHKAGHFAGNSQVKSWIIGIARHKMLDLMRQQKRQQSSDIDDHADELIDHSPAPLEQLVEQQQAAWVASCMDKLPSEQRDSLHLFFYEGMSLAEISVVQNCPDNTIKTRLFHAKRKIKECLSRWLSASDEEGYHV